MKNAARIFIIFGMCSMLFCNHCFLTCLLTGVLPIVGGICLFLKVEGEDKYYDKEYLEEEKNNLYEQSNW